MRQALVALALAALQVRELPPQPRALPPTNEQQFAAFGDYLESLRSQAGMPGMAGVIVSNDIAWERAFGQQDVERNDAAKTITPFEVDGLTQVVTTVLVLRCVESGTLQLDDRVGQYVSDSPEPNATIRQLLSHTSGDGTDLTFNYRPERLAPLRGVIRRCTGIGGQDGSSMREGFENLLEQLAMIDSAPGRDIVSLVPPAEGMPTAAQVARYRDVLDRLAKPYAVSGGRATASQYSAASLSLTAGGGLISTVRDFARFDVALRGGLLRADTLQTAWRAAVGRNGPLPHGLGWFVQSYNGQTVVWQIGESDNASSSMIVTVPARGFSFILMSNSDALVRPYALTSGDLAASPFGRVFLNTFVK